MNDPYDDNDDDQYDDDYYDYDDGQNNLHQFYFKFDVNPNTPLSQWINDLVNDMIDPFGLNTVQGFEFKKFPVNSWYSNTGKGNSFQYLGSNYHGDPIWKTKYFVNDKIHTAYKLHLQQYTEHFIKQPHYYDGLFDILN